MDWNHKLKQLMGEATQLVRTGHLADATRTIQQTLGGHPPAPATAQGAGAPDAPSASPAPAQPSPGATFRSGMPWRNPSSVQDVEDAVVIERPRNVTEGDTPCDAPRSEAQGSFTRVVFNHPGAPHNPHHYHLYVPPGSASGAPMPLVLMLHGCTQNPTDFATGTGMNSAAGRANALVLYPAQPHSANPNGCWNWFRPEDQRRDMGEPALLAAMVRDVMARHPVDGQRVYVAGLSAGGAMAALLGREYPDVFAAVGVHSGLSAGAAHNVMGALSAMKTGAKTPARGTTAAASGQPVTPVIVFHGDADPTVSARNGEQVVQAALDAVTGGAPALETSVQQGRSGGGQGYTRTVYRRVAAGDGTDDKGAVIAEHWVLHGAGHAWAGGSAQGSHTDPRGVDATGEMLRFFLAQQLTPKS